jgi:hypothetical protein
MGMEPHGYALRLQKDAERMIGRYEGKAEAFEEMARHLDPAKYCQYCGTDYREPGSKWGETREEHEAKCQIRLDKIAADKKKYIEEYLMEQSRKEGAINTLISISQ